MTDEGLSSRDHFSDCPGPLWLRACELHRQVALGQQTHRCRFFSNDQRRDLPLLHDLRSLRQVRCRGDDREMPIHDVPYPSFFTGENPQLFRFSRLQVQSPAAPP